MPVCEAKGMTNAPSVLRIGITCSMKQSAVCYPTADSMILARARSPNNKCLCVKRVWPMRIRVNLTSVLRIGITDHAPMTGFTGAVCYQLLTP
ncbi:hypothetical protein TNCV_3443831 [Trichonephila clavipes]|nr:hypothetical protein TNCV_3443831 [Trichonephila clavipes]